MIRWLWGRLRRWWHPPRVTIFIPLHSALRWVDNISEVIRNCPKDALIVVSDRTLEDNALKILRDVHRLDPRLKFLAVSGNPGWREHVNWFLPQVRSEFFSIMPQDDCISRGHYESLLAALDADPTRGIAFGRIEAHGIPGKNAPVLFPAMPPPPSFSAWQDPWRAAIALDRDWNLGIPFRGLIRKGLLLPILATPQDRFADQLWVLGMSLTAKLVEVPQAIYHKRYYPESTHAEWMPLSNKERLVALQAEVERRFSRDHKDYANIMAALSEAYPAAN